jgi:NTE family protein
MRPDTAVQRGKRIALVLSAGGLRGAAHVGVLRTLVREGVPIHAIVGVSAGAVVAAYYGAVGLSTDELSSDAKSFRGRHLIAYGLNVHLGYRLEQWYGSACGRIPERLRQLETATFDRLHHGLSKLGIVCHDCRTGRPRYFSTVCHQGLTLADAVRASASIPGLFPPLVVSCGGESMRLRDGGATDPVPLSFARNGSIGATHVIVSDCRWIGRTPPTTPDTVWIRPRMPSIGTLWSPVSGLSSAVRCGEYAVHAGALRQIFSWLTSEGES